MKLYLAIQDRLRQHRDNLALWQSRALRPTVEDDEEQKMVMHDLTVAIRELESLMSSVPELADAALPVAEASSQESNQWEQETKVLRSELKRMYDDHFSGPECRCRECENRIRDLLHL